MTKKIRAYDFFAGTRSATLPLEEKGHDVFSIDNDERFDVSLHADFLALSVDDLPWKRPDFVWASPPCTSFSMGSNRKHWKASGPCRVCGEECLRVSGERWEHRGIEHAVDHVAKVHKRDVMLEPKSPTGELGLALVRKTLEMIEILQPKFWIVENPVALMRSLPIMRSLKRRSTSYCMWGKHYRKPTDFWGMFPESLTIHPPCDAVRAGTVMHISPDGEKVPWRVSPSTGKPCHEKAERGSRRGTQGLSPTEAGMIPRRLASAVCRALERDLR